MQVRHMIESFLVKCLPTMAYRLVGAFYGYLIPPKRSYSQYGEDLIIAEFFRRRLKRGVYVDIGGFHPRWISNSHLLSKRGWSGVAVDVDRHKIRLFEMLRSRCVGIVAAVGPSQMTGHLPVYRFRRLWSELDTISLEEAQNQSRKTGWEFDAAEVPVIHINEVMAQAQRQFGVPNFLNIDVEGLDEIILSELDFQRFPVELVCFENNLFYGGSESMRNLLAQHGYVHLFSSGGSHGYARRECVGNKT